MSVVAPNVTTPGYVAPEEFITLINRTGATLAAGDIVALNLDFSATAGQAMAGTNPADDTNGAAGYVYSAAVAVRSANAVYKLAVATQVIGDDQPGRFQVRGLARVKVNGGNPGEFIVATNAAVSATPLTLAELQALTTGIGNVFGICLQATTGVQVALCEINGEVWRNFFAGDN